MPEQHIAAPGTPVLVLFPGKAKGSPVYVPMLGDGGRSGRVPRLLLVCAQRVTALRRTARFPAACAQGSPLCLRSWSSLRQTRVTAWL